MAYILTKTASFAWMLEGGDIYSGTLGVSLLEVENLPLIVGFPVNKCRFWYLSTLVFQIVGGLLSYDPQPFVAVLFNRTVYCSTTTTHTCNWRMS